jgi:hypothetical protein
VTLCGRPREEARDVDREIGLTSSTSVSSEATSAEKGLHEVLHAHKRKVHEEVGLPVIIRLVDDFWNHETPVCRAQCDQV